MKIKKTYSELINANILMGNYIKKNESDNKICAAIKIFTKQLKVCFEEFNDEKDTLQINNCMTVPEGEKKGAIIKDEFGNRAFSPEGELKLKAELKELLKKEVEIHARIPEGIDNLIAELDEDELEAFSGIVIPLQTEESLTGFLIGASIK